MSSPSRRMVVAVSIAGAGLAIASVPVLGGTIPRPSLESSVGNSDLGSVQVGKSTPLQFTLSSTAAGDSDIPKLSAAPALTGDTADFTITPGTCTTATELTTTKTCTSTVTFTPGSPGSKTVTVGVAAGYVAVPTEKLTGAPCTGTYPDFSCSLSFTVTGTGTAAPTPTVAAALTPATRVIRARRTAKVTVTASNPGTTALTNVVTSLPIPSGFVATDLGGGTRSGRIISWTAASLAAGGSTSYTATLRPIGVRARKATVATAVSATGATTATATATITVRAVPRRVLPVPVVG